MASSEFQSESPSVDVVDPNELWRQLSAQPDRIHEKLPIPDFPDEIPADHIRFVCISDTHSRLADIASRCPEGDVLIHAGDFTRHGSWAEVEEFNEELAELRFEHKIVIAGNHEVAFDPQGQQLRFKSLLAPSFDHDEKPTNLLTNCTYLENESVTVHGYRIYGSPHTSQKYQSTKTSKIAARMWEKVPHIKYCAFRAARGHDCRRIWQRIPTDTDILVTHGPPLGYGDCLSYLHDKRTGCDQLLHEIETRTRPILHVFGHIHEDYGIYSNGTTKFVNASTCDVRYRPVNPPIVIDLPKRSMRSKVVFSSFIAFFVGCLWFYHLINYKNENYGIYSNGTTIIRERILRVTSDTDRSTRLL